MIINCILSRIYPMITYVGTMRAPVRCVHSPKVYSLIDTSEVERTNVSIAVAKSTNNNYF